MTVLERHIFSKTAELAEMTPFWRDWAATLSVPVEFVGATRDHDAGGVPVVYAIAATESDCRSVREAIEKRFDEIRSAFPVQRMALFGTGDTSWPPWLEDLRVDVYSREAITAKEAARLAARERRNVAKYVAAKHPAEVSAIDEYSPVEFHIFFHSDEISRTCGLESTIEREIIERLHEIGLTSRTLENTKFIFTSVEELDRDYIRFYK